jgi:hypothetical protein
MNEMNEKQVCVPCDLWLSLVRNSIRGGTGHVSRSLLDTLVWRGQQYRVSGQPPVLLFRCFYGCALQDVERSPTSTAVALWPHACNNIPVCDVTSAPADMWQEQTSHRTHAVQICVQGRSQAPSLQDNGWLGQPY